MENTTNTSPFLAQNIFVELGLVNASEEVKMQILDQMNELLEKRLIVRIVENVDDATKQLINEKAESASEEELFAMLLAATPDFPQYLQEEVERVREEMKASLAA